MAKPMDILIYAALFCVCQQPLLVQSKEDDYLKSNKITEVGENWKHGGTEHGHRMVKRQTDYELPVVSLQDYIVDYHNRLRRQEGASNMQYMVSAD